MSPSSSLSFSLVVARTIVDQRNRIASSIVEERVPPMRQIERDCERCFAKAVCFAYHKVWIPHSSFRCPFPFVSEFCCRLWKMEPRKLQALVTCSLRTSFISSHRTLPSCASGMASSLSRRRRRRAMARSHGPSLHLIATMLRGISMRHLCVCRMFDC